MNAAPLRKRYTDEGGRTVLRVSSHHCCPSLPKSWTDAQMRPSVRLQPPTIMEVRRFLRLEWAGKCDGNFLMLVLRPMLSLLALLEQQLLVSALLKLSLSSLGLLQSQADI